MTAFPVPSPQEHICSVAGHVWVPVSQASHGEEMITTFRCDRCRGFTVVVVSMKWEEDQ